MTRMQYPKEELLTVVACPPSPPLSSLRAPRLEKLQLFCIDGPLLPFPNFLDLRRVSAMSMWKARGRRLPGALRETEWGAGT